MKLSFTILVALSLLYLTTAQGRWQSYVDDQLVGSGNINNAAIAGLDGSIWAKSPNFSIRSGELQQILKLFKDPSSVFASGVTVSQIKYFGIKADEQSIYGKKGAGGVILVKTNQAILIGIYDETTQPGLATLTVEKLGDYLRDNGY